MALIDWDSAVAAYQQQRGLPAPGIAAPAPSPALSAGIAQPDAVQAPAVPTMAPPAVAPAAPVPVNSRAAMQASYGAGQEAAQAQLAGADIQARQFAEAAETADQQRQVEAQFGEKFAGQQAAYDAATQATLEQFKSLNEEASRMQVVDRRSTAQKSMGILAVALGGLGDAFSAMGGGKTDFGARIGDGIDQAVERDMQLQREAISGKRAEAAMKMTELGLARSVFQDKRAAEDWAAAKRKDMYGQELAAQAARSNVELVRVQGAAKAAEIRQQAADKMAAVMQSQEQAAASNAIQRAGLEQRKQEFAVNTALQMQEAQAKQAAEAAKAAAAGPKTEGEKKLDSVVQGFAPAYQRLTAVREEGANRGATREGWVPDLFRSEQTLQQRADLTALAMGVLRAESGAAISDTDIEAKYAALPIHSGDPEVRAQGLRDLLNAAKSLDNYGRLDAPVDTGPKSDDGFVRMVHPVTGAVHRLAPNVAAQVRSKGWTDAP